MNATRLILTTMSIVTVTSLPVSSSKGGASYLAAGEPVVRVTFGDNDDHELLPDLSQSCLEPLSEADARAANLLARISSDPVEPALPLALPSGPEWFAERAAAADCLTAAIYYEAAVEPSIGKRAVAQVVLNRVRHPAFPNSICEVVMQGADRQTGCQFTFTCDGSLYRRPSRIGWNEARKVALAALSGAVEPSVGMSTHYHADYVRPYWASSLDKVTTIGAHIFYRWSGGWGERQAFKQRMALGRDYGVHRSARWQMAASYLYNAVGESDYAALLVPPEPSTKLPDEAAPSEDHLVSSEQNEAVPRLRADRERGTILADETAGVISLD